MTEVYARGVMDRVRAKKPLPLLDKARFEIVEEGECVQMMHVGPYDAEPASFTRMERFCADHSLRSGGPWSTGRSTCPIPERPAPEKMRTVLRFQITGVR